MTSWAADRPVEEELVRALLGQFPSLAPRPVRFLSAGWDRSVWRVGEELVFGFPRRAAAVPGIERELAVLPRLAPLLALPVPAPTHVGHATADFPWPFFGSAFLPGVEAGDACLDAAARTAIGVELAGFLRRLHDPAVTAALEGCALPLDPNGRTDMARRVPATRRTLSELERLGLRQRTPALDRLLGSAERLPPPGAPVVAHGDLHFRHVLVDEGRLSGVIDWIDLCRADPAIDLHLVWSFVPEGGRAAFLSAYGPVSDEQLVRARVLAVSLCAHLAVYGHAEGLAGIRREALAGLDRAATAPP